MPPVQYRPYREMHAKSIQALEFGKVVEKVAAEASFSVGRERVLALLPAADLDEARRRLAFTTEAVRLIDEQPRAGVGGARDIRPQLVRAARGGALTAGELVEVASTLRSAQQVARVLEPLDPERFPQMRELGAAIPTHPGLVRRLEEIVDEEGEILDSASPLLRRLRGDVRAAAQRLQERLRTLVAEFGHALQEPIVTMRSDRYVVPVKADFRGQVRGIVHDQSASGATLFVEPMAVVELNNRLRELRAREQEEIDRILLEVSGEIGREAQALEHAVGLLAELDLQLAKARNGRSSRCTEPRLNDTGRIALRRARHPLLTGNVVPIDFRLGVDFSMVVITGPNTGGKTVALKTVGLLTLMAQAGLHVPADGESELAVFEDVFADIGDEQSIEQSLSTFSSHMTRIIEVLRAIEAGRRARAGEATAEPPRALVLFDELGAGTDPSEGSALARSILTFLLDRGVATVATTHYSELKAFAHEQEGVVNASVEFDLETLSPTYELRIGLPGRSNALAIAERLGLDRRIVRGARRHLGSAGVRMEGLLRDLETERDAAADERGQLARERTELELARRRLEEERGRLEGERAKVLNEARDRARRELDELLGELAEIRVQARRGDLTRERLGELRRRAQRLEERAARVPAPVPSLPRADEPEPLEGPLQVGDTVRVRRLGQRAELIGLSSDLREGEVQMGPMRLRVGVEELERVAPRRAAGEETRPVVIVRRDAGRVVSGELNVRGWRVEAALAELESYLNDAALSGLGSVRILHGKGTGALRSAVREHLAGHPLVESYGPASPAEGGEGLTVARLAV